MKELNTEYCKELLPTKLLAYLIPEDSLKTKISGTNYLCLDFGSGWEPQPPRLQAFYEIIGEVTKDQKFTFDPTYFIELYSVTRMSMYGFKDYLSSTEKRQNFTLSKPEDSFISLLSKNKLFLDSLIGQKILILKPKNI